MTHSINKAKTYPVQDIQGHQYQIEHDQLIQAAQSCIRERFNSHQTSLDCADAAKDQIQVLLAPFEHEVFMALWLDNRHRIIHHEIMFRGTIDAAAVYPREVVKAALACNAAAVIFAHNHPSGITEPSHADIAITRKLKETLTLVDIRVLDHLIAGEDITSMAELGMV